MCKVTKERKPRKDGRYSINLSFLEAEKELIEYVDGKGQGFSDYIKELIRKDMNNELLSARELLNLMAQTGGVQFGQPQQQAPAPQPQEVRELREIREVKTIQEPENTIKRVDLELEEDKVDLSGLTGLMKGFSIG